MQDVITLPKGGGAMQGIGEKFSPDLHTGTGNFTVPIALPPGRNGFQPQLNLAYSTGNGNGPFGLGWSLSIPGVSRKTSQGVPLYHDYDPSERPDVFILSGAEDLVPVDGAPTGVQRYRPRTEGLFARIDHHHGADRNFWEVRSKDGLVSTYGHDPADAPAYAAGWERPEVSALIVRPSAPTRPLAWRLTLTQDPFGNRIEYLYRRSKTDLSDERNGHHSDQPLLRQIRYADFTDANNELRFLVTVTFEYADRPDRFSEHRAGFEIRTVERCKAIRVETHFDQMRPVCKYRFTYDHNSALNGVSLLRQIEVIGFDDDGKVYDGSDPQCAQQLPPLTFGYTAFQPEQRKFAPVTGAQLPAQSLASPNQELADLTGDGLPDILEMNGAVRVWRNQGNGRYDLPRPMRTAPPVQLADPGVQLLDADGDGRIDLLVTAGAAAGTYPLNFNGEWDRPASRPSAAMPSFDLADPEVRLVDLDGDGVTDAVRSGSRLECFFFDRYRGWRGPAAFERKSLDEFPNVNFSDPRVKWGDMTGDNLQDIVLVYDGNVEYWPNLGHGKWGKRIHMRNSPRFRDHGYTLGYDPRRILLGDVDGDGLADIVYVGDRQVTLWINQSGNGWSDPIVIQGTPPVTDLDAVRLVDLLGTGVGGVLWSADARGDGRPHMYFLDFTGGVKPYVLNEMDNHMGAVTKVQYAPSTRFYLADAQKPATRWKTPLPFPVQVVERVEVIDAISRGKLTTDYRYHHGYWDGAEREFRGFGVVEQLDTETFDRYNADGLHGGQVEFNRMNDDPASGRAREQFFSPPTLTKTWFHQGPVGPEFGDWQELDRSPEYWRGDPELLGHTRQANAFLAGYNDRPAGETPSPRVRRIKRDALRALRGSILRSELYALDGPKRQARPYTVTEHAYGLREVDKPEDANSERLRIFFPHAVAQRTTQWERGDDPMTQFALTGDYDAFGQPRRQTAVAAPRRSAKRHAITSAVVGAITPDETRVLATHSRTIYAEPQAGVYIHDRVAQVKTYESDSPSALAETRPADVAAVLKDQWEKAQAIHSQFIEGTGIRLIGHVLNHYDGAAFKGEDRPSNAGRYGALTRSEALVFTDDILKDAYADDSGKPSRRPDYLGGAQTLPGSSPAEFSRAKSYRLETTGGVYEAGYYADAKRVRFDFQDASSPVRRERGVVLAMQDALGHETEITPDEYWFLPLAVRDAVGNETSAEYNRRMLQPSVVTDPNGNRSCVRYNPIGLVHKAWLESNDQQGGTEDRPELRFDYDFLAHERSRGAGEPQPLSVHTMARLYHARVSDPAIPHSDETIESYEYSDGFGRLVQKRTQAEELVFGQANDGECLTGDDVGLLVNDQPQPGRAGGPAITYKITDSVVVSGWQTYDNKGRVVEKYEPFFDQGWAFQPKANAKCGQHATLFYDPRGQVIRTLNPDGSEQRVIYGVPGTISEPDETKVGDYEPTPWESYTYDANDLAPDSFDPELKLPGGSPRPLSDRAPVSHHHTPASTLLDGLGRVICQVQRNGADAGTDWYVTRSTYDIRGNLLVITDPLNRVAFQHAYDLLDRPLRVDSIDAGLRTSVLDAPGNLIEYRDSKGSLVLRTYDALNRPVGMWAINDATAPQTLTQREKIIYGDKISPPPPQTSNLRGKPHIHYDEAGKLTFKHYDFKGNLVEKARRVVSDGALSATGGWTADWSGDPPDESALEAQENQTSTTFDALNRPITITYPAEAKLRAGETVPHRAELIPGYNRAGALQSVELDGEPYVDFIAYNAKGQRVLIAYGNQVMTRYAYDPQTFRLVRLRTESYTANALQYQPFGTVRQDLAYEYDLVGNITAIHDRTPGCGLPSQPDQLDRLFTYDAIYRLSSADGRECDTLTSSPSWDNTFRCDDITKTRYYQQSYTYDIAGNILKLQHSGGVTGSFTRDFSVRSGNNRLDHITVGSTNYAYVYDRNGNLTQENSERHFTWDHADRMIEFRNQATPASTPSVEARYLYDAGGMRVKKWVRTNGTGAGESTTYIDGIFEYYRWGSRPDEQNNTLHVMDDQSRVALKREGNAHPDDGGPDVQYHLGDHLGSGNVIIGGADSKANAFINREEYYPYGETSFGSFGKKRYRFTGKERDEESGLYYHGARYYAPWLARWTSCDQGRIRRGASLYNYGLGTPIIAIDPDGREDVIIVGTQMHPQQIKNPSNKMNFVHQAIREAQSDNATVVLFTEGYTEEQLKVSRSALEKKGARIIEVQTADQVVDYLNTKRLPSEEGQSNERAVDPVRKISVFSHGEPGRLSFGLGTSDPDKAAFTEEHVRKLDPNAFAKTDIRIDACRIGLGNPDIKKVKLSGQSERTEESLAQKWADQVQLPVKAYKSRSDYEDTLSTSDERGVDLPLVGSVGQDPKLKERIKNRIMIDGAVFDPEGAMHPVKGGQTPKNVDNKLQTFQPRKK